MRKLGGISVLFDIFGTCSSAALRTTVAVPFNHNGTIENPLLSAPFIPKHTTMTPPTVALNTEAIRKAIAEECSSSSSGWKPAQRENVPTIQKLTKSPLSQEKLVNDGFNNDSPLYYALLSKDNDGVAIFFVEFSTWEGRVLFLKRLDVSSDEERVMRLLARIALRLHCVRLVWQHSADQESYYKKLGATTLDGVLTLKMDRTSIEKITAPLVVQETLSIHDAMDAAIDAANASLPSLSKLELKRATADDLTDIRSLVQGLADHVKESDSITTTPGQLLLDGFETSDPLYYCLLLNDVDSKRACGVAIIFFGYDIGSGRFLYLEDLFIEESYRGKGGGKSVMWALASISQKLDCGSFVWQALDWNKPSLLFYEGIGAKIQEGLLTSRFAGDNLVKFAA